MIGVQGLNKTYDTGLAALENIDFTVPEAAPPPAPLWTPTAT